MPPTIGRIVHYRLSARDVALIESDRLAKAQAERAVGTRGNSVAVGTVVPAVVTAVWPEEYGPGTFGINAHALLDGPDTLWVLSAPEGDGPGAWCWPPKV